MYACGDAEAANGPESQSQEARTPGHLHAAACCCMLLHAAWCVLLRHKKSPRPEHLSTEAEPEAVECKQVSQGNSHRLEDDAIPLRGHSVKSMACSDHKTTRFMSADIASAQAHQQVPRASLKLHESPSLVEGPKPMPSPGFCRACATQKGLGFRA